MSRDVVFIRHTDDAEEVDERFLPRPQDRRHGGAVGTGADEPIAEEAQAGWNAIYAGSTATRSAPTPRRAAGFSSTLLPRVVSPTSRSDDDTATTSAAATGASRPGTAREVREPRDIWPVFRGCSSARPALAVGA